jgi:hypothetical protein
MGDGRHHLAARTSRLRRGTNGIRTTSTLALCLAIVCVTNVHVAKVSLVGSVCVTAGCWLLAAGGWRLAAESG